MRSPVAVIDIGSNSSRVEVFERERSGQLRVLAGARAALRLIQDVDEQRRLSDETVAAALTALRDFRAIADGAGAKRIVAVATEAMRDASNGAAFIARVRRELGVTVEIIDGRREARYGFLGALGGLAVESGLLFDLGGGSVQVTRFRRRASGRSISLPLGALRLSATFLESDPPKPRELRRLREHVERALRKADVPRLRRGEYLVGTGGTLRNLAKIDQRNRRYPITRLHGYVLTAPRLHEIAERLAATQLSKRDAIPGLSTDRADSVVGGALAIAALLEHVGAAAVTVSGQGVREGLAYSMAASDLPSVDAMKAAALASLTGRFDGWHADRATRRRAIAAELVRRLDARAGADVAEALDRAALLLDIGRSIDFFNRHAHVADIVLTTELNGFTHEEIVFLAAVLRRAGDRRADLRALRPLVTAADGPRVERAAVLLTLADDIEERCRHGRAVRLSVATGRKVVVRVPSLRAWRPRTLGPRFAKAFGKELEVVPGQ